MELLTNKRCMLLNISLFMIQYNVKSNKGGTIMSVIRVEIKPEVILNAVEKSQRNIKDVKNRFNNFEKWINKEIQPTFRQLTNLSNYLRIPFGHLLLDTPAKEKTPLLQFRTIETAAIQQPSRELIDTIKDMERKQAWLREIYMLEQREPLSFVGSLKEKRNKNTLEIADYIREKMNLNKNWYTNANSKNPTFNLLRKHLSDQGIIIMQNGIALNNTHRPLSLDEFRAFTLIDEYAPLIFINSRDTNSGKTFSLLHELVHIFFGQPSLYNDDLKFRNKYVNPLEITCNAVAGEIITPTDHFIEEWENYSNQVIETNEKINNISTHFKVSPLIIARKALDQHYIGQKKYDEIAQLIIKNFLLNQKNKKSKSTGGDPINNTLSRIDHNFLTTLIEYTESGYVQYTRAYRLAGIGRGTFENVSGHLKGVR